MGRELTAFGFTCLAFTLTLHGPARAQSTGRNPAAAQALYDEARRLVKAGNYQEACPKFKESYQLDPGGGTLLNLADCYEKQGRLALAWSTFKEAAVVAQRDRRDDRVEFANQHVAALENRLAHITVLVAETARAPGLAVSVDGAPLGEAAWGVAMPVDPGKHVVRAEAPGRRPFVTTVDVPSAKAVRESVEIPALVAEGTSAPPDAHAGVAAPAAETTSSKRTVGWIVGGVGLASIGVGSYFGVRAFTKWNEREDGCKNGCTEDAKKAGDDSSQAATISTITIGVGLAAVGVGTFLLLTSGGEKERSSATAASLRIGPGAVGRGAGLWMTGEW